jgi:hypothetical protein
MSALALRFVFSLKNAPAGKVKDELAKINKELLKGTFPFN